MPNSTGGISLNVINSTAFLIQLTLAGPTRVVCAVPPGAIQALSIQAGNYSLSGHAGLDERELHTELMVGRERM